MAIMKQRQQHQPKPSLLPMIKSKNKTRNYPHHTKNSFNDVRQMSIFCVVSLIALSIWFNWNIVVDVNFNTINNLEVLTGDDKRKESGNENVIFVPNMPHSLSPNEIILSNPDDLETWSLWAKTPLTGSYRFTNDDDYGLKKASIGLPTIRFPSMDLESDYVALGREPKLVGPVGEIATSNTEWKKILSTSNKVHPNIFEKTQGALLTRRGIKHNTPDSTCGTGIKCNQDRVVMITGLPTVDDNIDQSDQQDDNSNDWWIGLFDGHGTYGHIISQIASYEFPRRLLKEIMTGDNNDSLKSSSTSSSAATNPTDSTTIIHQIFNDIQKSLPQFDRSDLMSGSTAISVWKRRSQLIVSTLGDSTVLVLSFEVKTNNVELIYENQFKHKPNDPSERTRIESMGGHLIEALEEHSSARLVVPDRQNPLNEMWIAMSRSLGNQEASVVGMSCEPTTAILDLKTFDDQSKMYFVVAASDGLFKNGVNWHRIGSYFGKSFVRTTASTTTELSPLEVAEKLIIEASDNWSVKGRRDDISIAVHRIELE